MFCSSNGAIGVDFFHLVLDLNSSNWITSWDAGVVIFVIGEIDDLVVFSTYLSVRNGGRIIESPFWLQRRKNIDQGLVFLVKILLCPSTGRNEVFPVSFGEALNFSAINSSDSFKIIVK